MSLRGEKRTEFPQPVRKALFARCCRQCLVEGVENIPGVPQCEGCGNVLRSGGFIYEHDTADGLGGEPTIENGKVHCMVCKKTKDKVDNAIMAKADRVAKRAYGLMPAKKSIQSRGFTKKVRTHAGREPVRRATVIWN